MMVTSEYVGRPRRWATGIELTEEPVVDDDGVPVLDVDGQPVMTEINPLPEGARALIAENTDAKFGQLQAADLGGYEASVRVILGQIMAVSTLPAHYVGVFTDNPASADALRAAEASLTARAEDRQATFGRSWEQVARLMVAVTSGRDPNMIDGIRVQWADAATRSVAQEADAVVKLYQAGILPASYALAQVEVLGDALFAATLAAILAGYNGRATSLAATAFAAQASIVTATPTPVTVLSIPDDTDRLAKAATTVLDVARASDVPEAIIGRLGRSEPLNTAARTYSDNIAASPLVEGWTRHMDADPCQLCKWWWRDGRVWPKKHRFQTHTGCACVPRPVWRKHIQSTGYTRRLERNAS